MNRALALTTVVLTLASCAKTPGAPALQAPALAPSSNVYLRNSFDTDPSSYIGRFVPEGLGAVDESAGMALACSQHISWRHVNGGGVKYTELLATSDEVSARLGVPVVANAKGRGSATGLVRVEYELTGKLIGEITDPVAFNACCADQPGQCTTRFIGEFLEGTGAVYHQADRTAAGQLSVITPQGGGGGEATHDAHWKRAVEFPNPVYFAFKTAGTTHEQSTGTSCEDWNDDLPRGVGGSYVLGVSKRIAKTETAARNRALMNAANSAAMSGLVKYPVVDVLEKADIELGDWLPDKAVTPKDWCVEQVRTEKGDRYIAKVLVFVEDGFKLAL